MITTREQNKKKEKRAMDFSWAFTFIGLQAIFLEFYRLPSQIPRLPESKMHFPDFLTLISSCIFEKYLWISLTYYKIICVGYICQLTSSCNKKMFQIQTKKNILCFRTRNNNLWVKVKKRKYCVYGTASDALSTGI